MKRITFGIVMIIVGSISIVFAFLSLNATPNTVSAFGSAIIPLSLIMIFGVVNLVVGMLATYHGFIARDEA